MAHQKSSRERVERRRAKLRAAGLRPVQIWVRDASVPGFAEECARQARLIAASRTPESAAEDEFWEALYAEALDDDDGSGQA